MPIPALDNHGLLPQGIFDCTFNEIHASFCWNPHRQQLFDGMMSFFATEWQPHNISAPILVDGSFVRKKEHPDDIDLVLDMTGLPNPSIAVALGLFLRRIELKASYKVDLWVRHPSIGNDLVSFFQYIGDKAAAELRLQPKYQKGILRVS